MNLNGLLQVLPTALKGWLSVFIVTVIIIAVIMIINKVFSDKK